MGALDRVEGKLSSVVEWMFARGFKGDVQPVEITARLQKELDSEAKLLDRERKLVPNDFSIMLSSHDYSRLNPYAQTLNAEIASQLQQYAKERSYIFNGGISINYAANPKLPIGRFTVTSAANAAVSEQQSFANPRLQPQPQQLPQPQPQQLQPQQLSQPQSVAASSDPDSIFVDPDSAFAPKLAIEINNSKHPLTGSSIVIGRGNDADLRINDPGISRQHARLFTLGNGAWRIEDLGSTNGITVNGRKVQQADIAAGNTLTIGNTKAQIVLA